MITAFTLTHIWFHSVGSIVLLALGLLSQGFDYIPQASLAAIIIAAVVYMIDFTIIIKIFKIKSKLIG